MNNCSQCTTQDWEQLFITRFQFCAWGIVAFIICVAGIVGNLTTICVLSHRQMRSSTSIYLLALAIVDILILTSFIFIFTLPVLITNITRNMQSDSLLVRLMYPITLISHTVTVYTTIGFTTERYLAVQFPIRMSTWSTRRRTKLVVLAIFVFSIGYNVPRMLENVAIGRQLTSSNNSLFSNSSAVLRFGDHPIYQKLYHTYMYTIFMFVLPFVLLFLLNMLLIRALRNSSKAQPNDSTSNARRKRREKNLTVMLLSVVFVFLVCQAAPMLDNIFSSFSVKNLTATFGYTLFYIISQVMVVINSAVNFIMYCCFGQKFRQTLIEMLFCIRQNHIRNSRPRNQQLLRCNNSTVNFETPKQSNSQGLEMVNSAPDFRRFIDK